MEKINFPGSHISSHFSRCSDGDPVNILYFAYHAIYFDEAFIQMSQKKNYSWENRKRYISDTNCGAKRKIHITITC